MVPGVRLVILGKQGAGKGTQAIRLARHYVVPHVSTGDMLRAAAKSGTALGMKAAAYMERGELIPDDVVIGLVQERLEQRDARARGYVLDGFPRTVGQADQLAKLQADDEQPLVVDLEVPTDVVLQRLAARRVCTDCGANYSTYAPPRVEWICDVCGGDVVQREDDTEDAIRRRLALYEEQTAPLIAWYIERRLLVTVDGLGHPDVVSARLIHAVDHWRERRGLSG
ncbi:MAG TPA: adenylate kinase [Acidimicrobiales bacterium]|nr:adenylate kinase [Acidimicrobiales bacterium]